MRAFIVTFFYKATLEQCYKRVFLAFFPKRKRTDMQMQLSSDTYNSIFCLLIFPVFLVEKIVLNSHWTLLFFLDNGFVFFEVLASIVSVYFVIDF